MRRFALGLAPLTALVLLIAAATRSSNSASAAGDASYDAPKIDPVVANGPIFVDWPKPQLAILFSGELDGYIEPCGCAGLDNQKGGLKRRHTLIKELEAKGWPLVKIDVGGLTKRLGVQSEMKYYYIFDGLTKMGYDAVGFGPNELKMSAEALAYALMNVDPEAKVATSANVGVFSADSGMTKPYRIIERGGKRIGVTTVLGARSIAELKNMQDLALVDPAAALAEIAPRLAAEKCDLQILLVSGSPEEATALSQRFPQFQIVMATGGAEEPPKEPRTIPGSGAALVETGHKGMYVIVLGMFNDADPAKRFRYQRVPLDARFADSPEMKQVLVEYQNELEGKELTNFFPSTNPHSGGDFAGSATCMDCHTQAAAVFEKTPHAHAYETLVELDPPRNFDPECLSCHVTGWNPQEYFPYATGFLGENVTPDLVGNGCENCHGPGKAHADAESGVVAVNPLRQQALRDALKLKIVVNEGNKEGQVFDGGRVVQMCMQCHDLDNSPDFDFQKYWLEVKHQGKD